MRITEILAEAWSQKYKSSINCSHPKGFSQKAHCAGKKKHNESVEMEMTCEDCGMCETHGNITEIKKGQKDANGYTRCWPGKHAVGTKKGRNGGQVRNCKPNESQGVAEGEQQLDLFPRNAMPVHEWIAKNLSELQQSCEQEASEIQDRMRRATGRSSWLWDAATELEDLSHNFKHSLEAGIKGMSAMKQEWPQMLRWIVKSIKTYTEGGIDLPVMIKQELVNKKKGMAEGLHEQFDAIEEMVEAFAQRHGVDAEQIWEDFESVDDSELLDESAAWRRKEGKSKKGGLNAKGVASYRRENPGSKLQTAVTTKPSKLKPGSKAAKRRKSFCARMGGVKGPMKKPNGKPTRKALALRKWNC